MKNKLTAVIIAALLLMVSCADRSHDSFIEDINGGKTTATPTPTPNKPQPVPVLTPQPQPKPVKPQKKSTIDKRISNNLKPIEISNA